MPPDPNDELAVTQGVDREEVLAGVDGVAGLCGDPGARPARQRVQELPAHADGPEEDRRPPLRRCGPVRADGRFASRGFCGMLYREGERACRR